MTLRLNGDSSGFTEIKAPNAAGDNSITLPTSNGGANQLLQNGGTAGSLQYTSGLHYDSSGRLLVGLSSSSQIASQILQGSSFGASDPGILYLARGTATPAASQTIGSIRFSDNTHSPSAVITGARDGGTWSAISKPAYLSFQTTPDGSTSGKERVRITSDGSIKLMADCPGIDFSGIQTNTSGMTNETLGSYEEGDFTVGMKFGTDASGFGFVEQFGRYTKIGDIVHLFMTVTLNAKGTASGSAFIHGLPFAVHADGETRACGHLTYHDRFASLNSPVVLYAVNDAVRVYMYHSNSSSGSMTKVTELTDANFNSNTVYRACLTYRTDG